jgi:hypothetical protein
MIAPDRAADRAFARARFLALRARTTSLAALQQRAGLPATPTPRPGPAPLPAYLEAVPGLLSRGHQFGRLAQVIETGRRHVQAIATAQREAARHLDSADVAIDRLLAEIRLVMPVAPRAVSRSIG